MLDKSKKNTSAEAKTIPTATKVEDFIALVENQRRREDATLALALYQEVTKLEPVMWGPSIIGFGEYQYRYESGRSGIMFIAGFSPRKANMAFYVGDNFAGADELFEKLGKHRKSKACLYINKLADVDLIVLKEIITQDFQATVQRYS